MENNLVFDCVIYDEYKDLLKKRVYEPIILRIMNESSIIFKSKYKYIENQAHNESDFVSLNNVFYDAKILFYERQCQALAINKDNLYTFISELQREINEIYEIIKSGEISRLRNSIFYREMVSRISKANMSENIILFIPFACTLEISDNLELLLKADIFTYLFKVILEYEKDIIKNNNIYIIYPNLENYIIIKDLIHDRLEFIMDDVFYKYIKFNIKNR